jgi:hypothetical protein
MKQYFKKKYILFIISLVTIGILATIKINFPNNNCGYQVYESQYTLDNGYRFTNIQVRGMKDKNLEKKINESLNSCFYILSDAWFGEGKTKAEKLLIHCQTDKYLSVEYIWDYITVDYLYWHLCVTVDVQSGELICLDDLIDVNEDFALFVKNGNILRKSASVLLDETAEQVSKRVNDYFSKSKVKYILWYFKQFTKEYLYGDYYRKNNYDMTVEEPSLYQNYFYLEEGTLCFKEQGSNSDWDDKVIVKISIDDIEDYLKVPKW